MAQATRRVRVTGRVQGVGFRAWTQDEADRHGLRGWVRNEPDGSVSALISGGAAQVEDMLRALRDGPPAASVRDVNSTDAEPPDAPGFAIR